MHPPIINGDHMLLHRNEISSQKTMCITGFDAYVKKNHNLFREGVTVYTKVSGYPNVKLNLEFVFKVKGTQTTRNPPKPINF